MPESFEVEAVIPAGPERVYAAWLDTKEHGAFTGSPALVEPWVGGRFTAHDGYLHGINLQLEPGKRIVQSWRSSEFPQGCADSRIYVDLEPVSGGTRIHIKHVDVPMGQAKLYRPGWAQRYFKPMIRYFAAKPPKAGKAAKAAASAPAAKANAPAAKASATPRATAKRAPAPAAAAKRPAAPKASKRAGAAAKRAPTQKAPPRTAPARTPAKRAAAGRPAKPAHAKPAKAKSSPKKSARKGRR